MFIKVPPLKTHWLHLGLSGGFGPEPLLGYSSDVRPRQRSIPVECWPSTFFRKSSGDIFRATNNVSIEVTRVEPNLASIMWQNIPLSYPERTTRTVKLELSVFILGAIRRRNRPRRHQLTPQLHAYVSVYFEIAGCECQNQKWKCYLNKPRRVHRAMKWCHSTLESTLVRGKTMKRTRRSDSQTLQVNISSQMNYHNMGCLLRGRQTLWIDSWR